MKNALIENLISHDFIESTDTCGNRVFEKSVLRTVRIGFNAELETTHKYIFRVKINPQTNECTVTYHSPNKASVNVEYKKASKAVWNAIANRATNFYGLSI